MDKKNKSLDYYLGVGLIGVMVFILTVIFSGYTTMYLWKWFISTPFQIHQLSFWHALGLGLFIRYLTQKDLTSIADNVTDESFSQKFIRLSSIDLLTPLTILVIGYIISLLM